MHPMGRSSRTTTNKAIFFTDKGLPVVWLRDETAHQPGKTNKNSSSGKENHLQFKYRDLVNSVNRVASLSHLSLLLASQGRRREGRTVAGLWTTLLSLCFLSGLFQSIKSTGAEHLILKYRSSNPKMGASPGSPPRPFLDNPWLTLPGLKNCASPPLVLVAISRSRGACGRNPAVPF